MSFLSELQQKRTDYKYASQARTQAQSLTLLSSGIYTEEERFVYELLQNAIDAFVDVKDESLNIRIEIQDDYLLFMHNGAAFTEADIEGLCDVGNGNKATDAKKVGYKGIGFKSVFMKSTQVFVKSGSYCFKFDKEDSVKYMPSEMLDGKLSQDDIPWQIIPIETTPPFEVDDKEYNVTTYIRLPDASVLTPKIDKLLKELNFLLFLNAQDVSIVLYDGKTLLRRISRKVHNGDVELLIDNEVISRWLIKTYSVAVTDEVRAYIAQNPASVPQKLREARSIEISFAISMDSKRELQKVDDAVVYTFLPTSYANLGAPFLINSNFITDAGRQQLQQDSEWNKLIFKVIPALFLKWIAELAHTYKTSYYRVLPAKEVKVKDELTNTFRNALLQAIEEIAFLPNPKSPALLKVAEAWIDQVGISEVIGCDRFIGHIMTARQKSFASNGQIANQGIGILKSYGVFIFSENDLPKLFENKDVFSNLSAEKDIELINFLFYLCDKESNGETLRILSNTPFILNENGKTSQPSQLFFPSDYKSDNELAKDVLVMAQPIYNHYQKQNKYLDWFKSLGVQKLDESTFLKELLRNPDAVTEDNAIEYGRFLFKCYQEGNRFEDIGFYIISEFPFITKRGRLKAANNLFLGSFFRPFVDIEPYTKEDFFISEDYLEPEDSISDWKAFFKTMGIAEEISPCERRISVTDATDNGCPDRVFFNEIISVSEKEAWLSNYGRFYYFKPSDISYSSYSFLEETNKYEISRIIFSFIIGQLTPSEVNASVNRLYGSSGIIPRTVGSRRLIELGGDNDYFKWLIHNRAVIPTQLKTCKLATSVFSNTIQNIKDIAGKYLPVIDLDFPISEEWINYLKLKDRLKLQDYLTILEEVAKDKSTDNKERVVSIYTEIIERGWQNSTKISEWGATHKILSSKNGEYLYPSELAYVTIDGFKSSKKAYIGKVAESHKKDMIELLKNFGVQVIDKVSPEVKGKSEAKDLKNLLLNKVQYIALLKESKNDRTSYDDRKNRVASQVKNSVFYHCKSIQLTYGDAEDKIERTTYSENNSFYYTGDFTPGKVEPLLSPLCKYLDIQGYEKELFVLMMDNNHNNIVEYLRDKGYPTDMLIAPSIESMMISENIVIDGHDGGLSKREVYAAQLEAQKVLMTIRSDWNFPNGYGNCDKDGKPYCYSTVDVTDKNGDKLSIVLKSYKDRTAPFKVNPEEWKSVVQKDAKLLVYTTVNGDLDIVEIPQGDLIVNQSKISITFNSENLDKDEYMDRVSAFAETLHYFKELHFDFDKFHIAENAQRVKDIYRKQKGIQDPVTDDDL